MPESVDIVTRTKDRPAFLKRALTDISTQDYEKLTWIVVNDGGDPKPVDAVIEEARANNIDTHCIHNTSSVGMEAAGNIGAATGAAAFIAIHDDDDTWDPAFLSRMTSALEKSEAVGVACWSCEITEQFDGQKISESSRRDSEFCPNSVDISAFAARNQFPPIAFLFRRSAYEAVGRFNEEYDVLGDWDFNLRLIQYGRIDMLREILANYHVRQPGSQNENSIVAGKIRHLERTAALRDEYLRKDLESGRFGIGALMAIAAITENTAARQSLAQTLFKISKRSVEEIIFTCCSENRSSCSKRLQNARGLHRDAPCQKSAVDRQFQPSFFLLLEKRLPHCIR